MAGHSHWAGIKHKKGITDAKRGKLFSKLAKNIMIAARTGGGDPGMNLKLKVAVDKAKAANMPKDNIERAIKKGTGELEGVQFVEVKYEGYGPGGVAIFVEGLTDNKNRTVAEIRKIFEKKGGNLGDAGCVGWMFDKVGLILVDESRYDEEALLEIALDAGADNVESESGMYQVYTSPERLEEVKKLFEEKGVQFTSAEVMNLPQSTVPLDAKVGRKVLALLDDLENHEDVQSISANYDIPDEVFEELESQ